MRKGKREGRTLLDKYDKRILFVFSLIKNTKPKKSLYSSSPNLGDDGGRGSPEPDEREDQEDDPGGRADGVVLVGDVALDWSFFLVEEEKMKKKKRGKGRERGVKGGEEEQRKKG